MPRLRQAFSGAWWPFPLLIAVAVLLLAQAPVVERIESRWLDIKFQLLRGISDDSRDGIVLVGIDEQSLNAFDAPLALWHRQLAQLFDSLRLAGPRVVGLDMALPDRDYAGLVPGANRELAASIMRLRAVSPVVLGMTVNSDGTVRPVSPLLLGAAGLDASGYLLWPTDADGVTRRFDERLGAHGERVPTLVGKVAQFSGIQPAYGIVNFGIGRSFEYVPAHEVIAWGAAGDVERLSGRFRGKIVLVGVILPFEDRVPQPVNLAAWDRHHTPPGLLLNAQALRSLQAGRMVREMPWAGPIAAVLAILAIWGLRRRVVAANAAAVALGLAWAGTTLVLLRFDLEAGAMPVLLAAGLSMAAINADALWRNVRERRRIRNIFAGYVSPGIIDAILSGRLDRDFANRRRPLAFLFADIRGFTQYSAERPPEEVIRLLNRYFTVMTRAIHAQGGTVDKFRGDGLMAFFGAPAPLESPARSAIRAALGMMEALQDLNQELRASREPPIAIGVGIALGDAVIGNVGSPERHDYTAIGAAVNLAAHIQEHCKEVPYDLLVETQTFALASLSEEERGHFADLGLQHLPKHGAVHLFGCRGQAGRDEASSQACSGSIELSNIPQQPCRKLARSPSGIWIACESNRNAKLRTSDYQEVRMATKNSVIRSIDRVYSGLADITRHREWAERQIEKQHEADRKADEVSARYRSLLVVRDNLVRVEEVGEFLFDCLETDRERLEGSLERCFQDI